MSEQIPIVNEKDELLYYKERSMVTLDEIYRVSALWIENSKGQVLLAQRSFSKKQSPGKWGPAVAGTVEKGETYESNILKEAEEEIGVSGQIFTIAFKQRSSSDKYDKFNQYFFLKLDWPIEQFKINENEVAKLKWFNVDDLKKELDKNPELFVTSLNKTLTLFGK
ncbi:MAG: NUDIX domain-containing protein [Candidatus Woesearchaeota archaeon]|jgi:isopentenyl-diphosphate delta-isomerase